MSSVSDVLKEKAAPQENYLSLMATERKKAKSAVAVSGCRVGVFLSVSEFSSGKF